jgi:hypothetical protein
VTRRENLDRSMSDRLFRPNHERRVLTTFRHVDELVSQAVSRLAPSTSATFLSEFVLDAQSDQHQMAVDCLERLRDLMSRFLESHQIPVSKPNVSALWAAHTACLHARLSVEELRASPMRGCGQLTPDAERELEALATALSDVLQRMTEFLAPPPPSPSSPGQVG